MASSVRDPVTSVPVHRSTLRLLQNLKTGAQTWDDFFREWVERECDRLEGEATRTDLEEFKRNPGPTVPWAEVRRKIQDSRGR
jgi:hypothetical protein